MQMRSDSSREMLTSMKRSGAGWPRGTSWYSLLRLSSYSYYDLVSSDWWFGSASVMLLLLVEIVVWKSR